MVAEGIAGAHATFQCEANKQSFHENNSTVLSWAAKRGYDVPLRLQMGYHCNRMQMAMTYSRDAATASIMAVQKPMKSRAGSSLQMTRGVGDLQIRTSNCAMMLLL